ncbi:cytochrome P450 CYP72A616-like isoform X2 [Wolffia australiana]
MISLLLSVAGWLLLSLVGFFLWKMAWSTWWTPRRLEKCLQQQGIKGTHFQFPLGDIRAQIKIIEEAQSKPIPFTHDIAPRVIPWIHQGIKKYGDFFVTWLGSCPRVIIKDPQVIKEVLSDKSGKIVKSKVNPMAKLLVSGIVAYEGGKWAKHRRIINRAFQVEKLKFMCPAFFTCCTELINKWEILVPEEGSCEIDVWPEFQTFTADAISRTAFGSSYEEGRRIFQLIAEQTVHFIQSFQGAAIPGYRFLPTKRTRRMKVIDRDIKGLLGRLVSKREKEIQLGMGKSDDLLGLLLESNKNQDGEEKSNSESFRMSTEEVIEECKLFYFAGQETTAVLLTWTMILLSVYQDWQARAREEVLQAFGGDRPEYEGLSQLKVVNMIFHEVLRLYPPGPFLARTVNSPMTLGKFQIPSGVHLIMPVISMHSDPEIWGEDCLEFKPERFSEGISKASKNVSAYLPFGGGPRFCIGQNFAMVEARFCLASILQRFSFELSPSYSHAPYQIITLQPQHGAQVILRKL